jgi:hypothetical protein
VRYDLPSTWRYNREIPRRKDATESNDDRGLALGLGFGLAAVELPPDGG